MAFEGYIDRANNFEIYGWIFDNSCPDAPLVLEIMDGEINVGSVLADIFRPDLLTAGKGNGRHGFSFRKEGPGNSMLAARVAGKRWMIPPSGGYDLSALLPKRFDQTLSHSLEYGIPTSIIQEGFSTTSSNVDDGEIAHRLIQAFKRTLQDNPERNRKSDQWADLEEQFHQELLTLLRKEDADGLAKYLREAHGKGITHGITQGEQTTSALRGSAPARRLVMLATIDHLVSLAEYMGVMDVECPDQHGQWGENIHADPLHIVESICKRIEVDLVPPQVIGSSFGLKTGRGILSTRDLLAFYAAHRLKTILAITKGKSGIAAPSSVCEIGGGLGGVAYYANRLGIGRYTIIDLPLVSLLQGFFLIRALKGVKIALYGEDLSGAAICLLPTYVFSKNEEAYTILANQDSLPEMHRDYSVGYVKTMIAKNIPLMFSINQEARAPQNNVTHQTAVRELVAEAGGPAPLFRSRHWLRAGYVEELFQLSAPYFEL